MLVQAAKHCKQPRLRYAPPQAAVSAISIILLLLLQVSPSSDAMQHACKADAREGWQHR
jgi:hypothetical protein